MVRGLILGTHADKSRNIVLANTENKSTANTPDVVGIIGLGAMGAGIAKTLARAGYSLRVCDARPGAATAFQDSTPHSIACTSPSDAAKASSVVISVVINAEQTESVLFGTNGCAATMRKGSVFVMCSTVAPQVSIDFETRLNALGIHYIDAPISGGAAKAAAGEMTVMSSAKPEAYTACNKVLDAMAGKVYRLGDSAGKGSTVKIINQLLAGVHIAAAAEAMALGLREGVEASALFEVITNSAGNSWMFENRMAHVINQTLQGTVTDSGTRVNSAVDIFVKDLGLVLDTARASKFPLPLAAAAHQQFMHASSAGFGKQEDAAVIKVFPGISLP